jgi:activator of 2-hydroxyglutaryl-CoA dehydratase
MNAQCAVFAESEVVSLIHAKYAKEDIVRAVHDAIADRIASMVRKIGIEKDVALVGGVARNIGFVDSLKRDLELDLLIPDNPEFSCALGGPGRCLCSSRKGKRRLRWKKNTGDGLNPSGRRLISTGKPAILFPLELMSVQ